MSYRRLWVITLCIPVKVIRHFGGTCRLHLQVRRVHQLRKQHEAGSNRSRVGWHRRYKSSSSHPWLHLKLCCKMYCQWRDTHRNVAAVCTALLKRHAEYKPKVLFADVTHPPHVRATPLRPLSLWYVGHVHVGVSASIYYYCWGTR
jgi:hypothetical protein